MTKIQKAKQEEMGYVPRLIPNTCQNCSTFACEEIVKKGVFEHTRTHTTNHRCLKGGFKVKKMGSCNEWTEKV